jgi:hypothetical protein
MCKRDESPDPLVQSQAIRKIQLKIINMMAKAKPGSVKSVVKGILLGLLTLVDNHKLYHVPNDIKFQENIPPSLYEKMRQSCIRVLSLCRTKFICKQQDYKFDGLKKT